MSSHTPSQAAGAFEGWYRAVEPRRGGRWKACCSQFPLDRKAVWGCEMQLPAKLGGSLKAKMIHDWKVFVFPFDLSVC